MISHRNRFIGAVLLVSGTTIGAGMLALPVTTGLAGFLPSVLLMTIIWLFMMLTAYLLLEVNLRMRGESNIISMMKKTLGKPGEIVSWVVYLLLLYSLTAAYLVACSQILSDFLKPFLPDFLPNWLWPLILFLIFGSFVYFGTEVVDLINRILMIGLVAGYIILIAVGLGKIEFSLLGHFDWKFLLPSTAVVLTSFGYHIIIPTLTTYLDHDVRQLKWAIFIGSVLPFIVYLLWQLLVVGILPKQGDLSLEMALQKGLPATVYLQQIIGSPWVSIAARLFAFFAIVTSLLGVTLSLSDFLADGFRIKKNHIGKVLLISLTFIPPLLFALFYPEGFIIALNYAGIFVAILLALLPALMAWFERYHPQSKRAFLKSEFIVPGGRAMLMFTILFSLLIIGVEVLL